MKFDEFAMKAGLWLFAIGALGRVVVNALRIDTPNAAAIFTGIAMLGVVSLTVGAYRWWTT